MQRPFIVIGIHHYETASSLVVGSPKPPFDKVDYLTSNIVTPTLII